MTHLTSGSRIKRVGVQFIPQRGCSQTSKAAGWSSEPILSRSCLKALVFEFSDITGAVYCLVNGPLKSRFTGHPSMESGIAEPAFGRLASRWMASTKFPSSPFSTPTPHTPGCCSSRPECLRFISRTCCSETMIRQHATGSCQCHLQSLENIANVIGDRMGVGTGEQ